MTIRVLVADDHEVVRLGLRSLLSGSEANVVAEASSAEDAVTAARSDQIDVVLLDVRMGDGDGLGALGRIKSDCPNLPVVMWSAHDNPSYVARAVALGASGYVLKGSPRDTLVDGLRKAASGANTWTRDSLRRVTGALATPRMAGDAEVPLTQRESEVLIELSRGSTNKEIAKTLKISYETVKEHVQHILRKIGVSDRTQAAVWAVRKGLV